MAEQHEKTLVPQIRFAGFTDPWEQRKLGEVASKRIEKNTNGIKETFTNSAEHGIVSQLDYFDHDITNDANIGNYSVVYPDDFVYNPRISAIAPCGPINRNKLGRNGVMSPLYTVFSVDDMINKLYLEHYFTTNRWHQFMFLEGNSGARSDRFSISDSTFFEMPIQCPVLEEQELIALFFDRLDSLITLHQRKYDKLCVLKKSMLDKMFPKGGSLYPEIRFAGFTDPWEQRKLGDVAAVYDGVHQTPDYQDEGVMFLSVENIATLTSQKFISREAFAKNYPVYPKHGDVLMTRIGDIGTSNVVETDDKLAFYVSLALLKPFDVDSYYLDKSLQSPSAKEELYRRTLHIAFPKKINKNQIAEVMLPIPRSRQEQEQIGALFRDLDSLITLHQRKLELLRNIKKSMLDKMFV